MATDQKVGGSNPLTHGQKDWYNISVLFYYYSRLYLFDANSHQIRFIRKEVFMSALLSLDGNLLLWIQNHLRADAMNGFWTFITSLGNGGWFWIVLGIILLFFPKTRKLGLLTLASMLIGFLITNVCLKNLVARPRPYTQIPDLTILVKKPHDWSFPSGHTTASFAYKGVGVQQGFLDIRW